MEWVLVLIIVFIIIVAIIGGSSKSIAYRVKGALFSPAERSFLGVLDSAVSDSYRVFGKVRVADILTPAKGTNRKNWQIAFNKISAKHFDFVLCCKDTLNVIAVIELDDKSHGKDSSISRDKLLNMACESAGLKLIRFPAKTSYSVHELREVIGNAINSPDHANV